MLRFDKSVEKFIGRLSVCSSIALILCLSVNFSFAKPFSQKEKLRTEIETEDTIEVREEHPEPSHFGLSLSGCIPAEYINYPKLVYGLTFSIGVLTSSLYNILLFPSLLNIPPPSLTV